MKLFFKTSTESEEERIFEYSCNQHSLCSINDETAKTRKHLLSNYAPFLYTIELETNSLRCLITQYCMKCYSLMLFAVFIKCSFSKLKSSNPLKVFKCTFALFEILYFKGQHSFDNCSSM